MICQVYELSKSLRLRATPVKYQLRQELRPPNKRRGELRSPLFLFFPFNYTTVCASCQVLPSRKSPTPNTWHGFSCYPVPLYHRPALLSSKRAAQACRVSCSREPDTWHPPQIVLYLRVGELVGAHRTKNARTLPVRARIRKKLHKITPTSTAGESLLLPLLRARTPHTLRSKLSLYYKSEKVGEDSQKSLLFYWKVGEVYFFV